MDIRAVAYEPGGKRIGVLPDALELTVTVPHLDTPTVAMTYPSGNLGVRGDLLDSEVEVAVEYTLDGTTWVEGSGCRFVSQRTESNLLNDGTDSRSLQAVHISARLNDALVWDVPTASQDSEGKWNFLSRNAGVIISTIWNAAVARGWGQGLTLDATTAKDASGVAWSKIVTLAFDKTVSLAQVVESLVNLGVCDVEWVGRTMRVLNPDTLGKDRSSSVIWPLWQGATTAAPESVTWADLCTDVLVKGEEGSSWVFHNDKAAAGARRVEKVVEAGGVSLEATARMVAEATLASGATAAHEVRREWNTAGALLLPWRDYRVGDWVSVERKAGRESLRVAQVSITRNAEGVEGHTTFGTKLDDLLSRLAKKTKGITGGASTSGSGVRPAPEGQDKRTPAKVQGLTVRPTAVPAMSGGFVGVLEADWADVTTATDGTALEVELYEIAVRPNTVGAPWAILAHAEDSRAEVQWRSPGETAQVKVRAKGRYTTVPGVWSAPVAVTIPNPEPLDPPHAITATGDFGMVTLSWDGLLDGPTTDPYEPPAYFSHAVIEEATGTNGPWTAVGEVTVAGPSTVLDRQAAIGDTRFYRAYSVDLLKRQTEPGPVVELTIRSRVTEALEVAKNRVDEAAKEARENLETLEKRLDSFKVELSDEDLKALEQAILNAEGLKALTEDAIAKALEAARANRIVRQAKAPAGTEGVLWVDTKTGFAYTWDGKKWAPVNADVQEAVDAAQNALNAAEAAAAVAKKAQAAAEAAQRTADKASLDAADAHNALVKAQEDLEKQIAEVAPVETGWVSQWRIESDTALSKDEAARTVSWPSGTTADAMKRRLIGTKIPSSGTRTWRVTFFTRADATGGVIDLGAYTYRTLGPAESYVNSVWPKGGKAVAVPVGAGSVSVDVLLDFNDGTKVAFIPVAYLSGGAYTITGVSVQDVTALVAAEKAVADAQKRADDAYALAASKVDAKTVDAKITASANGKNAITTSTVPPVNPGVVSGDIWWRVGSDGSVIAQWVWDGSKWAIRKIDSEVITNLDVHKLTVSGNAKIADAVIIKLWADGIAAKVGEFQRLVVAGGNLWPDPTFEDTGGWASENSTVVELPLSTSGKALQLTSKGKTIGSYYRGSLYQGLRLEPGYTYVISGYTFQTSDYNGDGCAIQIVGKDSAGKWANSTVSIGRAEGLKKFSVTVKSPENLATGATVRVWIGSEATKGSLYFFDALMERRINSTLIEPGAITTGHLSADAVTADKIAANSIESGMIKSGAIEGKHIKADAIDGKTITGATIRTAATGARVQLASSGLYAYNSSNALTASITGNGGSFTGATFTGGTITGATFKTNPSGARIEMSGTELRMYDSSNAKTFSMSEDYLSFWDGARYVGWMGQTGWAGKPNVKGVLTNLESAGDYLAWTYRESETDVNPIPMMLFDPKGVTWGEGRGIKIPVGVVGTDDEWKSSWAPFRFTVKTLNGVGTIPAITWGSNKESFIAFSSRHVYVGASGKHTELI